MTIESDRLLARIAELEARIEQLERRDVPSPPPDRSAEPSRAMSRRRVLGLGGAAVAGAAGAALAGASPASAGTLGAVELGASGQDANVNRTGITSTATTETFRADNTGAGNGITGTSATGAGVAASASNGYCLKVEPLGASSVHVFLAPGAGSGAPSANQHFVGELFVDQDGVLYQCVAAGVPGTWVRQSPLVTLTSPVRIYYSVTAGDPLLSNGQERSVTVTNGTTIPHSASAVLTNLAVTPSGADGFLAMFKDGTSWPGTSNLNYSAGMFASNNATSEVAFSAGTGKVKIHCGGGAVHFVIDVFGYYP